ncbi:hypothetical protein GCM10009745_38420 [Kribbella yunnanensis]|uniref:ESX-1 secretion-associated protein n=1 Tax=Kribbella yunnanensis TaxID=190194 RepID=A0ABN2HKM0_9ACTN
MADIDMDDIAQFDATAKAVGPQGTELSDAGKALMTPTEPQLGALNGATALGIALFDARQTAGTEMSTAGDGIALGYANVLDRLFQTYTQTHEVSTHLLGSALNAANKATGGQ